MNLINNTQSPALAFHGVDQQEEEFHIIVTRQTYKWDDNGLLVYAEEQDALCMMDQLVDPADIMSGVVEESDLCHYKPKCDVIVKGHAYPPNYRKNKPDFKANIRLQTPDKIIYPEQKHKTKYEFANNQNNKNLYSKGKYIKGDVLIDKTLIVLSPRYAVNQGESLTGNIHYTIKHEDMTNKVSLNPSSSFGGYCFIEESNPIIEKINKSQLIPEEDRDSVQIKGANGRVAYFAQDSHNPSGSGSMSNIYHHAINPKQFKLPQIHSPDYKLTEKHLEQMANDQLDPKVHQKLVNGFGIRSKSHPNRLKYAGTLDQDFANSDKSLPEDFDFAVWNCAYPDQQVSELKGDEWITLTNLCGTNTKAVKQNDKGDTILNLYLPEVLPFLVIVPLDPQENHKQPEIKIDTVIISPDEEKVNIVWRSIIKAKEAPQHLMLELMTQKEKKEILSQYFTQKGEVVRPYVINNHKDSKL